MNNESDMVHKDAKNSSIDQPSHQPPRQLQPISCLTP